MTEEGKRLYSRDFKLAALARMEAGANVSALCRELGIRRKYLYQWRERFRVGGPTALRTRGRPTKAEALTIRTYSGGSSADEGPPVVEPRPPGAPAGPDALTRAELRIAELERKVGQQQVELDFFQRALRQVRGARLESGVPGVTGSTGSSGR
jgi:transposase-like protein